MAPSVSKRVYIKWFDSNGDGLEEEPTSAIVLSDGSRFVDVRILKRALESATSKQMGFEALDWAFSGYSVSEEPSSSNRDDSDGVVYKRHTKFVHEVDSRAVGGPAADDDDEGDFRDAGDGTTDEIEVGRMVNPATGRYGEYEERWADGEVAALPGCQLRRCVVMGVRDPTGYSRGLLVLLGTWMQSIMRRGEHELYVERWMHTSTDGASGSGAWSLVAAFGPADCLPCPDIVLEEKPLWHRGVEWEVINVQSWK